MQPTPAMEAPRTKNKPIKPNLPNQTYQTKPTKPNLPNQTKHQEPAKECVLAMLTTVVHGGGEELDVEEVVAPQGALHLLNHAPVGGCLHFVIFTKYLILDIDTYKIHSTEDTNNGKV